MRQRLPSPGNNPRLQASAPFGGALPHFPHGTQTPQGGLAPGHARSRGGYGGGRSRSAPTKRRRLCARARQAPTAPLHFALPFAMGLCSRLRASAPPGARRPAQGAALPLPLRHSGSHRPATQGGGRLGSWRCTPLCQRRNAPKPKNTACRGQNTPPPL